MTVTLLRAGFLATVQDFGRVGYRHIGVSIGGALDTNALRIANLLAGNEEHSAGIEFTFGNARLKFDNDCVVAWCGGGFPVQIGDRQLLSGRAAALRAGDELIIGAAAFGCRAWLAISGGIEVPSVLGSRSTDTRGAFGGFHGRTLKDNDVLPLGPQSEATIRVVRKTGESRIATWSAPPEWTTVGRAPGLLRFVRGPEWDRFEPGALKALTWDAFRVASESDRMGVRFEGLALESPQSYDLLSSAVAPGTIQVPPSGNPILLLGDCQTVGGYPKIAHVITVDLPIAAQLRARELVHFKEVSLAEAYRLLIRREEEIARFRIGAEALLA